jgi:branched-chain amino acid transport system permease protein
VPDWQTLAVTFVMPDWRTFAIGLVVGVATGCVYALVAIAFNLVLAACGVFNLTISAVITVTVITTFLLGTRSGWPPLAVIGLVLVMGAVAGAIAEVLAVRRVIAMRPKDVAHDTMVTTLGLGMAVNALAAILFGTNIHPVDPYVSATPLVVSGVPIRPVYVVMPIVVAVVVVAVELMLRFTEFGIVTRAVIASNEGASLAGINVTRVVQGAFIASGVMAALAGFLIAPVHSASAFVGESVMLYGFAAIAIGGFGSFRGALFGGLAVGLILGLTPAFTDATLSRPFVYAALVIILFIRPAGLFGRGGQFGATSVRQV